MRHDEMVKFHAKQHEVVKVDEFRTIEEYLLYLIHQVPYVYYSNLSIDKTVLDLGCNVGYGTNIISRNARKAIGVDVCEKAIVSAKENFASNKSEFHLIDGKTLPFDDDSIDSAISCQVIEHIVDYSCYIEELKRCLAPGSISVFTTPNATLRLCPGMKPWNEFHHHEFTASELRKLLSQYFEKVSILGLYAHDDLYSIEERRAARAREFVRGVEQSLKGKIIGKIKLSLPTPVIYFLKSLLNPGEKDNLHIFANKHSVNDFWYKSLDVEKESQPALDLLAICSDSEADFQKALNAFLTRD